MKNWMGSWPLKVAVGIVAGVAIVGVLMAPFGVSNDNPWWKCLEIVMMAGLLLVALFQKPLEVIFGQTRLLVSVKNGGDCSLSKYVDGENKVSGPIYYWHLIVENLEPKKPAKKVRLLLAGISKYDHDQNKFIEETLNADLEFTWSPAEANRMGSSPTIISNRPADLVSLASIDKASWDGVSRRPTKYNIRLQVEPFNLPGILAPPIQPAIASKVRYKIVSEAHNAVKNKPLYVEVSWNGQWSDDPEEMNRHLQVREVKDLGVRE